MRIVCLQRRNRYYKLWKHCSRCYSSKIQSSDGNGKPMKFAPAVEERVFSGIQPTGVPHLGNYIGAIRNWVNLQNQHDSVIISVVDLHSISITKDPDILRENIFEMAACLIACGIDPSRSILFQQSRIPEHAYLSWILGCLCTLPRLSHLPQWKEKSKKVRDPGLGLFSYPVLQAADILLYKSTVVPVGEDQIVHLELARDLARAFNRNYGLVFPECNPLIGKETKLCSLRHPTSKMSKSEENPLGRIDLNDSVDVIHNKIKKAVTDSEKVLTYDQVGRPALANLFNIHSAITGVDPQELVQRHSDLNKAQYKTLVANVLNEHIQPIREEMTNLLEDRHELTKLLLQGSEKAAVIAQQTVKEVNKLIGFR